MSPAAAPAPEQHRWHDRVEMLKLFLGEKSDPQPFYQRLAAQTIATLPFDVAGRAVLDLGCGPGHYTRALRDAGAAVVPVDLDRNEFALPGGPPGGEVVADARRLPVADRTFDAVVCSNMLEHTPGTTAVLHELHRVVREGGWVWLSWTNWFSPWGGHEITPFHYLGPRLGLRAYRRVKGEPRKNVPGIGLFPVHIGRTLDTVRRDARWELVDAHPRYYPSQRWIMKVPGFREVVAWNCVLLLRVC